MQPGDVVQPGGDEQKPIQSVQAPQDSTAMNSESTPSPIEPENTTPQSTANKEGDFVSSGFEETPQYHEPTQDPQPRSNPPSPVVTWTASEYIEHQKPASWYLGLVGVTVIIASLTFLITKDWIAFGAILTVMLAFGVFAKRKPEVLQYAVESSGITIGNKQYIFDEFSSFSIHDDGAVPSAVLMPTKRFSSLLTIHLPPDQADDILDTLSLYLPFDDREPDVVDRLMKRVRF